MKRAFYSVLVFIFAALYLQPVAAVTAWDAGATGAAWHMSASRAFGTISGAALVDISQGTGVCDRPERCVDHSDHLCSSCGIIASTAPAKWDLTASRPPVLIFTGLPDPLTQEILRPPRL